MTLHRIHRIPLLTAIAAATLLAGCGGGANSSGSPQHLTQAQAQRGVLRYTACVRSHGVPNLPDPGARGWKDLLGSQAPAVLAAEHICTRLVPGFGPSGQSQSPAHSPAQTAAMVAFAGCLRSHGFPSFPDPTSSGELTHEMLANAGIDIHQPAIVQAADACVGVTHGIITKAIVARFVAGQ
jgi:hypothetical protein